MQTGAHVYIINGLEGPPNQREVNMYLVAHPPLTPKISPQITKLQLKVFFFPPQLEEFLNSLLVNTGNFNSY